MSEKYKELLDRKPNVFSRDKYAREKIPAPTQNDYDVGYFSRYFAKKYDKQNNKLVEINRKQFNSWSKTSGGLKRSYYRVLQIQWKITGTREEVLRVNFNTIRDHREDYRGLENKITDLLQFWNGKERGDQSISYFEAKQLLDNDNRDGEGI